MSSWRITKTTGKFHIRSGSPHRFKTYRGSRSVCGKCPLREECLTAKAQVTKQARVITRLEHAAAIEANHDNLYNNPGVYQQRQAIVEHPFGTLKRQWTGYYTLLRGKEKVDGEYSLLACCYNIRRSMSIFGVLELLERLEGRFSGLLSVFRLRRVVVAQEIVLLCGTPCGMVVWRREVGLVA